MEKVKKALVFGGGGALGAYEIGVWNVLQLYGYRPDLVVGTSVGALNAAIYAQGEYENAYRMWKNITTDQVFAIQAKTGEDIGEFSEKLRVMNAIGREALIHMGADAQPLRKILECYVDEDRIRKSGIELGVVCMSLRDMRGVCQSLKRMKKGTLIDWLMASAAIFPAVRACKIEDAYYIDGGYYDTVPCEFAEDLGAREILAVDTHAVGLRRSTHRAKVSRIEPEWDLGSELFFKPELTQRLFELGRLDALKHYNEYEGVLYAFAPGFSHAAGHTARIACQKLRLLAPQEHDGLLSKGTYALMAKRTAAHLKTLYRYHSGKENDSPVRLAENAGRIFELDPARPYTGMEFDAEIVRRYTDCTIPKDSLEKVLQNAGEGREKTNQVLAELRKSRSTEIAAAIARQLKAGFKNETERGGMRLLAAAFPAEFLAGIYVISLS